MNIIDKKEQKIIDFFDLKNGDVFWYHSMIYIKIGGLYEKENAFNLTTNSKYTFDGYTDVTPLKAELVIC